MTNPKEATREALPADLEALMPEPAFSPTKGLLSGANFFTADQMREAIRGATERAAKKVPANWLDSMLTGPDRVPGIDRSDSRTIETLLHRIAAAIRSGGEAGS